MNFTYLSDFILFYVIYVYMSCFVKVAICLVSIFSVHGATFVLGDAFTSDGSGDFDSPALGTGGIAGNVIDSVYQVNADGNENPVFGNPFNDGNAGGTFNPLVVGDIFGTDYRSTLSFDLAGVAAAIGSSQISSIQLFLEVSDVAEIDGVSVDVDVYANTGVTTGSLSGPDATFTVNNDSNLNSNFLPAIDIPVSTLDLSNSTDFLFTLDVADAADGIRFGSGLSNSNFPNQGINGTNFVQVAPRLVITTIPEPSTLSLLGMIGLVGLSYRKRKIK